MEYWNNGLMEHWGITVKRNFLPIVPIFQQFIIPRVKKGGEE